MMTTPMLQEQTNQLEGVIRQGVIEIRQVLPALGYHLKKIYKEGQNGLLFCAQYELTGDSTSAQESLGYLRVSVSRQSGNHSLVTQVRQMLPLAQERDQVIIRFYVEAGMSGADNRRPAFQAMMRDAVRGTYTAIFCYDLYRFYRNLMGLVNNYRTLAAHSTDLISVAAKDTDLNSRFGKLLMYLRGIMGEMYLDDLRRTITDNKFKRASQGYSNASIPPLGYCRGKCFQCTDNQGEGYCPRFGYRHDLWRELGDDESVFVPHPVDQHAIRLAFELYETSTFSDQDVAQRLSRPLPDQMAHIDLTARNSVDSLEDGRAIVLLEDGTFALQHADRSLQFFRPQGQPGCRDPDRRFSRDAIRDLLQNPYYAGFVVYRQQVKEDGKRQRFHRRFKSPLSEMSRREQDGARLSGDHGVLFPGRHLPLIETQQFEQCQRVRGLKGHNASNVARQKRIYPLSGVLTCARCGEAFRGTAGNGNVRYYEDGGRARGTSNCPRRMFRACAIEEEVFTYVKQLQIPQAWDTDILFYLQTGEKWDALRRKRQAVLSRISAVREMRKDGLISQGELKQAVRRCERRLDALAREKCAEDDCYTKLLRGFPQLWETATVVERKGIIRSIFSAIWFQDGQVIGYDVRAPFSGLLPRS
jgi:DNA invertase Pin-like site-specific DNA recombinase